MTTVNHGSRHHHCHHYGQKHPEYNEAARLAAAKAKARKLGKKYFDFYGVPHVLEGNDYVAWYNLPVGKDAK